jgi:hypothetical protein
MVSILLYAITASGSGAGPLVMPPGAAEKVTEPQLLLPSVSPSRAVSWEPRLMEDRLPIFDNKDRHESSPASHGETSFAFLNRVAGEFWENPRRLLQEWANRLPVEAYADIRGRLRESNDQARSAFLELYIIRTFPIQIATRTF